MTILVSLNGGIGNLLFQICAARQLSNSGREVRLLERTAGLYERAQQYIGDIELRRASSIDSYIYSDQLENGSVSHSRFVRLLARGVRLVSTQTTAFDEVRPDRLKRRSRFLDGYFQHPSWYSSEVSRVTEQLRLNRPSDLPESLNGVAGIHIRRSDYVRLGWELPNSFYREVSARIGDCSEISSAIVASDDQLVEELFSERLRSTGLNVIDKAQFGAPGARRDFYLLSASEQFFMSNSTFSWWSAKLHQQSRSHKDGQIHCPEPWLPSGRGSHLIDATWDAIHL